MTQQDKELLLKDLCARLPYRVKCQIGNRTLKLESIDTNESDGIILNFGINSLGYNYDFYLSEVKPYLRPMSSMTEEEYKEYRGWIDAVYNDPAIQTDGYFYWLNKKMFDYRGLIKRGLVLEAPEEMY